MSNLDAKIEGTDLDDLVGYNLKRAYIVVQDDYKRAMGPDGMSARVFTALSLTHAYPNITQSELARRMGIERSGLVAIVDALETRGYLRRAPVPGDRRVQALVPTEAGRHAYQAAINTVRAHEAQLLTTLSRAEQAQLLSLLRKIRKGETG